MALQIWLPMTKDLRNQGLDDVTVTNNGATFNSAGKLGGCYQFGTGNSYITVDSTPLKTFTEFSFACWVKIISWNTSYSTIFAAKNSTGVSWNNLIFSLLRNSSNSTLCFNIAGSGGYTSTSCQTDTLSLNTWYHITCTYKSGQIKLYQDGSVVSIYNTSVVPSFSSIVNLWIGKSNENSYQSNILLNDVRIYDHALSPLEVKHISQGLILHYPLNRNGWGQENLYTGSHDFYGSWVNGSIWTTSSETYKGFTVKQRSSVLGGLAQNIPCSNGDIFTISFYAKVESGGRICSIHRSNLGNVTTGLVVLKGNFILGTDWINATDDGTQWNRYWATLQIASSDITYLQWRIENSVANKTLYICGMKLEKGDKPTPWCPNSSDELATTLGMNDNIEYDCSGYCNNGEYYAYDTNGSISYTSDTPKYNVSTRIASANPTQSAASGTRYLYGHCELMNPTQMSVAFWLKPITGGYSGTTSNGQGYFCTTNYEYGDTSVGVDYQASAMNHRDGNVDMNDSASTTQCRVTFYPTIGEWHHYVYTYDGQVGRGYKDGVQTATAQFSAAKTLDSFIGVVIGFSKAGGVWRRNDACYSDFRVYATALSAEDIKDLYNLGASIDSNNNLLTYELNEE